MSTSLARSTGTTNQPGTVRSSVHGSLCLLRLQSDITLISHVQSANHCRCGKMPLVPHPRPAPPSRPDRLQCRGRSPGPPAHAAERPRPRAGRAVWPAGLRTLEPTSRNAWSTSDLRRAVRDRRRHCEAPRPGLSADAGLARAGVRTARGADGRRGRDLARRRRARSIRPAPSHSTALRDARASRPLTPWPRDTRHARCVAVVTHGGVIRTTLELLAGRAPRAGARGRRGPRSVPILNGSILHLDVDERGPWRVRARQRCRSPRDADRTATDAG